MTEAERAIAFQALLQYAKHLTCVQPPTPEGVRAYARDHFGPKRKLLKLRHMYFWYNTELTRSFSDRWEAYHDQDDVVPVNRAPSALELFCQMCWIPTPTEYAALYKLEGGEPCGYR
jgi:hypothetical protein